MAARNKNLTTIIERYAEPLSPGEIEALDRETNILANQRFTQEYGDNFDAKIASLFAAERGKRSHYDRLLYQYLQARPLYTGSIIDLGNNSAEKQAFKRRQESQELTKRLEELKLATRAELIDQRGLLVRTGDPNVYRLRAGAKLPDWAAELLGKNVDSALLNPPAEFIGQAARGSDWEDSPNSLPIYKNIERGMSVEYARTELDGGNVTLDDIKREFANMSPRTADVWRLTTAAVVNEWRELHPQPIWVDVRDLVEKLGYKRKTNGTYRPEVLGIVANAYRHLQRMTITILEAPQILGEDPITGERKPVTVETITRIPIIEVNQMQGIERDGQFIPYRWKIALGDWVKRYPRDTAPLMLQLVQLPAKGPSRWAKAIGMELVFHYARINKSEFTMTVGELLRQANLYGEAEEHYQRRNLNRAADYLSKALTELVGKQVLTAWEYVDTDHKRLNLEKFSKLEIKFRMKKPIGRRGEILDVTHTSK